MAARDELGEETMIGRCDATGLLVDPSRAGEAERSVCGEILDDRTVPHVGAAPSSDEGAFARVRRGLLRRRAEHLARRQTARHAPERFSIVSNDCWGGEIYRLAGRPYSSPFIGLMVMGPCFVRIVSDLDAALASPLHEVSSSRYEDRNPPGYPIGVLAAVDAELHFLHYATFADAAEKWHRRAIRVDREHLFVKAVTDKDHFDPALAQALLDAAPGPTLVVGSHAVPGHPFCRAPAITDAVTQFRAAAAGFDHVAWLHGGDGRVSGLHRARRWFAYSGWR